MSTSTSEQADRVMFEIQQLFEAKGHLVYGESVTQREHALQCAALADGDQAPDSLVIAALLHDVGHMLHRDAAQALGQDQDDLHEAIGAKFLARWFGPEVTEPIALHVQAKRYLCWRDPQYLMSLSPLSQKTLALQGGVMTAAQADDFERLPHARSAIALRLWDDAAKFPDAQTPSLADFLNLLPGLLRPD